MKIMNHGFMLKTWLSDPDFIKIKSDLEILNHGRLAWSRQVEYPWAIIQSNWLNETHKVLDAGAGHSVLQKYLCKKAKQVINVDIDSAVVVHEKEIANLSACVADIRKMPFQDCSFDAAFCISVLEHVGDDPMIPFNECMRVIKPGGKFYLTVDVSIEPSPYDFSLDNFVRFAKNLGVNPVMPVDVLRSREYDVDCHVDQLAVYAFAVEK
jgi:ubiquinone/menaquinone biosynthesis C-methylase UbiE